MQQLGQLCFKLNIHGYSPKGPATLLAQAASACNPARPLEPTLNACVGVLVSVNAQSDTLQDLQPPVAACQVHHGGQGEQVDEVERYLRFDID